jgi:ribosomal-protein-alanine N-acetyltransferase
MGGCTRPSTINRTMTAVHIRDAIPADIDATAAIERVSFTDPWSADMFHVHLRGGINTFLVADEGMPEQARRVVGFVITHTVADESELLNIAVHPDHRDSGIGTALLDTIVMRCTARGARTMVLDVRESNTAAHALYAKRGFTQVGRRRRYYRRPEEDGLIFRAILPVPTSNAASAQ